jgi:hypothetical protein
VRGFLPGTSEFIITEDIMEFGLFLGKLILAKVGA